MASLIMSKKQTKKKWISQKRVKLESSGKKTRTLVGGMSRSRLLGGGSGGGSGGLSGSGLVGLLGGGGIFLGGHCWGEFFDCREAEMRFENAVKTKSKKRRRKKGFRRGGEGKKRKEERNWKRIQVEFIFFFYIFFWGDVIWTCKSGITDDITRPNPVSTMGEMGLQWITIDG